jgi:sialidase-1
MLNDFNGQIDKWYIGGEYNYDNYFPNEGQAVELLPNKNSIFINARSISTKRIGAYSNDGGLTFNKIQLLNTLVQPIYGCEGSTIYHQNSGQLFYTGLAETSIDRNNLSLYTSKDNGENWTFIKTIVPGPSAYSSMTILNDQSIALLYESCSNDNFMFQYDSLTFTVIYNQTKETFFQ